MEKQWESIVGNCDTFLYLGGNEQATHKYVSENGHQEIKAGVIIRYDSKERCFFLPHSVKFKFIRPGERRQTA